MWQCRECARGGAQGPRAPGERAVLGQGVCSGCVCVCVCVGGVTRCAQAADGFSTRTRLSGRASNRAARDELVRASRPTLVRGPPCVRVCGVCVCAVRRGSRNCRSRLESTRLRRTATCACAPRPLEGRRPHGLRARCHSDATGEAVETQTVVVPATAPPRARARTKGHGARSDGGMHGRVGGGAAARAAADAAAVSQVRGRPHVPPSRGCARCK